MLLLVAVFGGMTLPMYSLCLAHTNDFLEPQQMVAASGTLILVNRLGASFGPLSAAVLIARIGPDGFFWWLARAHAAIVGFTLYRMARRPARPLAEQGSYVAMPPQSSPLAGQLAPLEVRDRMDQDLAAMSRAMMDRR